jgi:predicted nucleotidyltransferase component of viral defense system
VSIAASGLAHSVHTRLIRHAQSLGVDPNLVLNRFATERLLYRLYRSRHADRFVLKGGLLLLIWFGETFRVTRDADLLGFGDLSDNSLITIILEICSTEVEPDAVTFDTSSIRISAIRPEDIYGGRRITLLARLGSARIRLQVDVGIGDTTIPEPEWIVYPVILDFPHPRLRAYRPETVIAEKAHAMVQLGTKNSRMRDFFDVYMLSQRESFGSELLAAAFRATFERRGTAIPTGIPTALTPEFAQLSGKRAQWTGFLKKNRLTTVPEDIETILKVLSEFLVPIFDTFTQNNSSDSLWPPGGPWEPIVKEG